MIQICITSKEKSLFNQPLSFKLCNDIFDRHKMYEFTLWKKLISFTQPSANNRFYHIPLEPWIVTVWRWGMDFTIAWKLRSTFDCPSITLCEKIEVIIETWLKKAKTALNLRRTKRWKGLPTMNISITCRKLIFYISLKLKI